MLTSTDKRIQRIERALVLLTPHLTIDRPADDVEAARLAALQRLLLDIAKDVQERSGGARYATDAVADI